MAEYNLDLHPILKQMDPSQDQIAPVLERGRDIAVTAGAGTGKTRTLVARYLSLLAEGIPLRSIVAITFTKKAAREMRNRVREEVRRYLQKGEMAGEDADYWRSIYENLDAARISTIHSLAGDILRQHPAEMGLDPGFELLDEGQAARLKAQSVEAAMAWGSGDPIASAIYPVYGDWKLRRVISELLNKRLEIEAAFCNQSGDIWERWQPILLDPIRSVIENPEVVSALDEMVVYESNGVLQRAAENGDLLVEDLRIVIESWKNIKSKRASGDWVSISRLLGPLRSHLKQKGKKENWVPGNPRDLIKSIQPIFDDHIGMDNLDLAVDHKIAREIVPGIRALFNFANDWYDRAKDQMNGLDFDDLEKKSLALLEGYPEVKAYWQDQITALLVDEYQDTNSRQRDLVNGLNGGRRRLFIVGDGKQSIYRFRGADVAVFRQEQEAIAEQGSSFQLSTSYRAHPDLLENLNSLLEPVLGRDKSVPYIEPFAALDPGRRDNPRIGDRPYLEFHLAAGGKSDGADRTAAEAVAARINEIVQGSQDQVSGKAGANINYGDIAVLCRASNSFTPYESAFEKAGIPYLTIAGQGFYDRPEIRDLLNALAAFLDPQNDLAVAGLMRSPAVGFPDEILLYFRDLQRKEGYLSLYEAVLHNSSQLDGAIKEKAAWLIDLLENYSNRVGRISASDLLAQFLEESGYLAAMAMGGYHRNLENMKKLAADAQNSGIVSLGDFLSMITELRNVAVRESEAASVTEGSVQIMTVHQAKGLEFPVVILGDVSKRDRIGRDILVDPVFGIVPPLSETRIEGMDLDTPELVTGASLAYEIALEDERLREDAENRRLFYVAATRAQELLILSGFIGRMNKDGGLGKLGGWLEKVDSLLGLSELDLNFELDGDTVHSCVIERDGIQAKLDIYENQVDFGLEEIKQGTDAHSAAGRQRFPLLEVNQVHRPGEKAKFLSIPRASKTAKRAAAPARIVGDLVHRSLQLWKFPDQGESDFLDWASAEFISRGLVGESEIKDGYRRVKEILERFQEHDLYRRMAAADKLFREVPYSLVGRGGQVLSGIIDALFLEDERWFVVEYKTDEIRDKNWFDRIWQEEDYQEQVKRYIEAVNLVLGQEPGAILCFLNYEKRVHLVTDRW